MWVTILSADVLKQDQDFIKEEHQPCSAIIKTAVLSGLFSLQISVSFFFLTTKAGYILIESSFTKNPTKLKCSLCENRTFDRCK